jgi:hypothetical protein
LTPVDTPTDDTTDGDSGGSGPVDPMVQLQQALDNQTGNLFVDLLNGDIPLGSLQIGRGVAWSLLNSYDVHISAL